MKDKEISGVENAGLENDGQSAGLENAGLEMMDNIAGGGKYRTGN